MARSADILARIVDASYFSNAVVTRIYADSILPDLVALRFEFSLELRDALTWAFNIVGQLDVGEAIVTQTNDRVLCVRASGLPNQEEKQEWLTSAYLPAEMKASLSRNSGAAFTVLILARCNAALDPALYTQVLRSRTWIGSFALNAQHKDSLPIVLRVGAGTHSVAGNATLPLAIFMGGDRLYGCYRVGIPTQYLVIRRFCGDGVIREARVDIGKFFDTLGIPKEDYYGVKLETNIGIDICASEEISPALFLSDLQQSPSKTTIRALAVKHIESRHLATSRALEQRAHQASKRNRVRVTTGGSTRDFGLEPTNENETIIITTRLENEIAKHFFGEFSIREYTAREGIDSIVRYKRSIGEPTRDVNTEFEFDFRNFFQHRHPLQQVDLIICWTMSNVANGEFRFGSGDYNVGELTGTISTFRDWLKVISFAGRSITVIPLLGLPNLVVEAP